MFYATDPDTDYNGPADERAPDERELQVLSHVHDVVDRHRTQGSSSGTATATSTDAADSTAGTSDEASSPGRLSQRSIARALGMSVGLTNAILKRLTDKGFLMMRRINHNNAHYLVTPAGVEQISRRSYLYLRRTIGHVVRYKERLRDFCREQKLVGVREIVLIGESDLAFILEWCAEKEGLGFRQVVGEAAGLDEPVRMHVAVRSSATPPVRTSSRAATTAERCRDQATSAEPVPSVESPNPDRMGGEVVYILSELHPEADSRHSSDSLVLLHEIVLGNH